MTYQEEQDFQRHKADIAAKDARIKELEEALGRINAWAGTPISLQDFSDKVQAISRAVMERPSIHVRSEKTDGAEN